MKPLYQAQATAIGGRNGSAATADGMLRVNLAQPKALGGDGGAGNNPEQLFAAGYASCFLYAIKDVAGEDGVAIAIDSNVTAAITIGERDDDYGAELAILLQIDLPGFDEPVARQLVERAYEVCPYTRAMHGNIRVQLTID